MKKKVINFEKYLKVIRGFFTDKLQFHQKNIDMTFLIVL